MEEVVQLIFIIPKSNRILAISRKPDHKTFGFLSGKVMKEESLYEALYREIYEEVNGKVVKIKEIFEELYDGKLIHCYIGEIEPIYYTFTTQEDHFIEFLTPEIFIEKSGKHREYNKSILGKIKLLNLSI